MELVGIIQHLVASGADSSWEALGIVVGAALEGDPDSDGVYRSFPMLKIPRRNFVFSSHQCTTVILGR